MSQKFITKAVLKEIYAIPNYQDFKVIDLSCGEGEIIEYLAAKGCEVEGTHYREDDYIIKNPRSILTNIKTYKNVALDQDLPLADASYELVIATEVLEHLPTHFKVISEAGRILKENGYIILTTPNIYRLHSKLNYFLTGTHKLISPRIGWHLRRNDLYAHHINPVDFPVIHTLLYQAGIKIEKLAFTKFKIRHSYLFILYPILFLATFLEIRVKSWGKKEYQQGAKNLFKWMVHPAMLASEQLLIVGKKIRTTQPE